MAKHPGRHYTEIVFLRHKQGKHRTAEELNSRFSVVCWKQNQCRAGTGQAPLRSRGAAPCGKMRGHNWKWAPMAPGWCCCFTAGFAAGRAVWTSHSQSFVARKWEEPEKHQRRRGCKTAREQSVLALRFMDQPVRHLKFEISHLGDFMLLEIGIAGSLGGMS